MKKTLQGILAIAVVVLATGSFAKADTIVDPNSGSSYTLTATGSAGNFTLTLAVDTSTYSAAAGYLSSVALSLQDFTNTSVTPTVTLTSAPGGIADWTTASQGTLQGKNGCANSGTTDFFCTQGIGTANITPVPDGTYDFVFNVLLPAGDVLNGNSDVKAEYNACFDVSSSTCTSKNLAQTSMGITIQNGGGGITGGAPEPASLTLLGSALFGGGLLARLRRKKRPSSTT